MTRTSSTRTSSTRTFWTRTFWTRTFWTHTFWTHTFLTHTFLTLAVASLWSACSFATTTVDGNSEVMSRANSLLGNQDKEAQTGEVAKNAAAETKPEGLTDVTNQEEDRPLIQIAILLDTSNSMDGLIEQAKSQLWSIVNNLVETKKDGKVPRVEVALFEYGNDGLPVTEDYLRQVVPLTTDLDKLSEALFALKTNGGSEYCGSVISKASKVLNWGKGQDHYKAIFIAGNEPFNQGQTDYTISCASSRADGIVVNTIHCGNDSAGVSGKWRHGAEVGGGRYMVIDSDKRVATIPCPQDEILIKLNLKLNKTYIRFGKEGVEGLQRQLKQDASQQEQSAGSFSSRIASKANLNLYRNSHWDLVDAIAEKDFDYNKVDRSTLPEPLQKLSIEELKTHVDEQKAKRLEIQKEISKLSRQREDFLADYAGKNAVPGEAESLGKALNSAALDQAKARGFKK